MRPKRLTSKRGLIGASALIGMALVLSACTGTDAVKPSGAPEATAAAETVAAETGATDAPVAATCAGVSVITTTVGNAQRDFASGTISDSQLAALMDSAYIGYKSLLAFPADQRGLRAEIETVVAYIDANPAPTQRFDPTAAEYQAVITPLSDACVANGSEIAGYGSSGG